MDSWAADAPPGYKPYGDLNQAEFFDKHFLGFNDKGVPQWNFPGSIEQHGYFGTPMPNSLQPGAIIDRISYKGGDGDFAAPEGTPLSGRVLPPDRLSDEGIAYFVEQGYLKVIK